MVQLDGKTCSDRCPEPYIIHPEGKKCISPKQATEVKVIDKETGEKIEFHSEDTKYTDPKTGKIKYGNFAIRDGYHFATYMHPKTGLEVTLMEKNKKNGKMQPVQIEDGYHVEVYVDPLSDELITEIVKDGKQVDTFINPVTGEMKTEVLMED